MRGIITPGLEPGLAHQIREAITPSPDPDQDHRSKGVITTDLGLDQEHQSKRDVIPDLEQGPGPWIAGDSTLPDPAAVPVRSMTVKLQKQHQDLAHLVTHLTH